MNDQQPYPVQRDELAEFLVAYVEQRFNFSAAARAIKRNPRTIYRHLESDAEFRAAFEDTKSMVGDIAYAEAIRRAVDGVDKPVYQGGECVGYIREYSDTLLARLLEATRPEFARRQQIDVTSGGKSLAPTPADSDLERAKRRWLEGEVIEGEVVDENDDLI